VPLSILQQPGEPFTSLHLVHSTCPEAQHSGLPLNCPQPVHNATRVTESFSMRQQPGDPLARPHLAQSGCPGWQHFAEYSIWPQAVHSGRAPAMTVASPPAVGWLWQATHSSAKHAVKPATAVNLLIFIRELLQTELTPASKPEASDRTWYPRDPIPAGRAGRSRVSVQCLL